MTSTSNNQPELRSHYDSVIIGGGHNGLVCAAYLARADRSVLVLERRHVLGGAAVTEEVYPGFQYSVCSYVVSLLRPEIIRDLELPRHGLEIIPLESSFTPQLDGPGLVRGPDSEQTRREIAQFSQLDAERYPEFGQRMMQVGRMVKPILEMVPPDPTSLRPGNLLEMLKLGRLFQNLSEADRILQDTSLHEILGDPETRAVLQRCGNPREMDRFMRDPKWGPRLRKLIDAGVVKIQR